MARTPEPWWWEERQAYYATISGVRHRLGDTKKAAQDALKRLQQRPPEVRVSTESVAALLDAFLDWTLANRAAKTYRGYKDFCQAFKDRWPRVEIGELQPIHITEWLSAQKTWNSTTKRGAITCMQRAMNWGTKNWNVKSNPLHGMEKPEAQRRETIVSPNDFKKLLGEIKDEAFKDLLIVSNEVGCRPQEVKILEARHIDLPRKCWFIPKEEAKGKRRPRFVYMTPVAEKIVRRLLKQNPTGKLFRNQRGRPWTASAVKCRFDRLEEKLGVRYCQYHFRHTWITRKLIAGVDSHVVAALAGHSDTAMIDRFYSKVASDHKFMLEAARKK